MTVLLDRTNIREASKRAFRESGATGARREIVVIEAGWGSSGYYSEQVLERDIPRIFPVGSHMYLDHPTVKEDVERPERSVRDLVGVLVEAPRMAGIASVAVMEIFEHWLPVIDALAEHIGLSIRAFGVTEDGPAGGKEGPIIQTLTEGLSIDFVTMAGAGGKIGQMTESARAKVMPLIESARAVPIDETLASDLREDLNGAGQEAWGDEDTYVYCEDFDEEAGYAIFWVNPDGDPGYYYKVDFTEGGEDGDAITLGEPETVDRETSYVPAKEAKPPKAKAQPRELAEARNAGNYLEARIHRNFTELADNLFGEGHLTREERIALSSAIGDGLQAFSSSLEEEAPQLFQRDPYQELDEPEEQYITETKCGSGRQIEEDEMSDADKQRLSELEESLRTLRNENADLKEENGKLTTRVERSEEAELRNEASLVAVEAIGEPEGLTAKGIARAVREATRGDLPTDSQGRLDRSALEERARAKARDELEYLGHQTGSGQVRGLGESRRESQLPGGNEERNEEASEDELTEAFKDIGMPAGVAKLAARGR